MNNSIATYWWILGIITFIVILLFLLSIFVWTDNTWIKDCLGIICGIASLLGVVLALVQITQNEDLLSQANKQIDTVSRIAVATQEAVIENKKEIRQFLSFSEIGHLIEIIKNTQNCIRKKDYSLAVILLQNIKDDMLRADSQFDELLR